MWKDRVVHFARSDVGIKRSHNQDSFGALAAKSEAQWRKRGHFYVVADGMGAHAVGELASKMAVQALEHNYPRLKDDDPRAALRAAFAQANDAIHAKGQQNPEFRGMGTTATALALVPEGAIVGHCGDSRCYRIRGDAIEQLTYDHSLQWELARQRRVPPEQLGHIPTNVIVRSLGPQAEVRADVAGPYPVQEGDRFVLCSDGLSGLVSDEEIWAAVAHLPGNEAVQFLVDWANLRGGIDNITVVLVQVGERAASGVTISGADRKTRLKRQLLRVPSEWWWFAAGMGTSGLAAWLLIREQFKAIMSFALFALAFLAAALFVARRNRRGRSDDQPIPRHEPGPDDLPVHRRRECTLGPHQLETLAGVERRLREVGIEQVWRVEWDDVARLRTEAENASLRGEVAVAFPAYCRAITRLAKGLQERRNKQEVLIPQWDRMPH